MSYMLQRLSSPSSQLYTGYKSIEYGAKQGSYVAFLSLHLTLAAALYGSVCVCVYEKG